MDKNISEAVERLNGLLEEVRLKRIGYDCSPCDERWLLRLETESAAEKAAYDALPGLLAHLTEQAATVGRLREASDKLADAARWHASHFSGKNTDKLIKALAAYYEVAAQEKGHE